MPQKVVHGYAWYTFPDVFGLETADVPDPGHPFSSRPGEVAAPPEVIYCRPANPGDSGLRNEHHSYSYLVLTKTQHHPKLPNGWDSEPANLTGDYKTHDGKVKMVRIVDLHRRHSGNLLECELKVDDGA
jgi:hypothetical protein